MVPAVTQLVKHYVGFVVSWLLGFGFVDPRNRPGPVPGSILSDLGSGAGSFLENIPEAEQGPRSIFQLLGPSWTLLGVTVQPQSDTVLGLGSVVLHPRSLFFPGWQATLRSAPALLRRAMKSYSPAGRKEAK